MAEPLFVGRSGIYSAEQQADANDLPVFISIWIKLVQIIESPHIFVLSLNQPSMLTNLMKKPSAGAGQQKPYNVKSQLTPEYEKLLKREQARLKFEEEKALTLVEVATLLLQQALDALPQPQTQK